MQGQGDMVVQKGLPVSSDGGEAVDGFANG